MSGVGEYFTPQGLSLLQGFESSGNPSVVNASGHAGLYQFSTPLWQTYAPQAGVDTSLYPTANLAPADVQTQVAAITPASNWLCQGCDTNITNAVAQDPTLVSASPTSADELAAIQDFSGSSTGADPALMGTSGYWGGLSPTPTYAYPNGEVQNQYGLPSGTTGAGTSSTSGILPFVNIFANIENWLQRGALIILGIVLVAAAAWALSNENTRSQVAGTISKIPG